MKQSRIWAAALAIVTMAGLAAAQPEGDGPRRGAADPEMREKMKERMKTELGLTDEQSAKMEEAMKAHMERVKALRDGGGDREQNRAKFEELQAQHEKDVSAILTPEQFEKWKAGRERMKEHMKKKGGRPGGPGGGPPPAEN
jgi:Spy/CpxP family protein refolding chaperone